MGDCIAAESPTVSATAIKQGRWDKAWKMRGHLVGPVGLILDDDGDSHSPLLFLLADTLPNNLLDFRIHDLVVAGRLHSLRKGKYKQNSWQCAITGYCVDEKKSWRKNKGKSARMFYDTPPQILSFEYHSLTPCRLVDLDRAWQLWSAWIFVSCSGLKKKQTHS